MRELHGWKDRIEELSQELAEKSSSTQSLHQSIKDLEERLAKADQSEVQHRRDRAWDVMMMILFFHRKSAICVGSSTASRWKRKRCKRS
jgi:hypothetical protein